MSQKLSSTKRLFKPRDFETADRVERLYMHRLDPIHCKLTEKEMTHFSRLRHAMLLLIKPGTGPSNTIYLLSSDLGISMKSARTLVEQVPIVYPDLMNNSKTLEKEDAAAMIHRIIEKCQEELSNDDQSIILKAIKQLGEIREWGKEDTGLRPGDIVIPKPIWSDDPNVLLDNDTGIDGPIDTDFEELESGTYAEAEEE